MALSHVFKPARKWAKALAVTTGLLIGAAGMSMGTANAAAPVANVVVCGYGDPGGGCAATLVATGHIAAGEPIARPWYPADLNPFGVGMGASTDQGLPNVTAAIDDFHARGFRVRLHGYSQGSDLALAAGGQRHVEELLVYGSPFTQDGFFHADYI